VFTILDLTVGSQIPKKQKGRCPESRENQSLTA